MKESRIGAANWTPVWSALDSYALFRVVSHSTDTGTVSDSFVTGASTVRIREGIVSAGVPRSAVSDASIPCDTKKALASGQGIAVAAESRYRVSVASLSLFSA